jgi:RNA polymerase sigma factor (sigma-70 family)
MEPNPAPSDAELVARYVHQRSDDAFAELVNRYVDLVYATAVRQVVDPHTAEDVTQAVFLLLAGKAAGFDAHVVLPGWLHRTTRLTARDAMKMRARRLRHERAAARAERVEPADGTAPSPDLDAALGRLSTSDRDALLLRYWQGLAVGEVAARLGVAENTAAKRLERAVGRLRAKLTGEASTVAASLATLAVPAAPDGLAHACGSSRSGSSPAAVALARAASAGPRWPAVAALVGLAAVVVAAYVFTTPPRRPPRVAAAPPLVPIATEQAQQIRAAIYMFRHYDPFAGPPDWPAAIRTLVTIGRPAVPELVAELDRTDKNSELRAIGYTLRCIPDARAVPALISALRRTPLVSSDLGLKIDDPALSAFMHAHQPHPEDEYVDLGQASREILGALHNATKHAEGGTYNFHAGPVDDKEMAAARKRLDTLADAWQRWWDGHHATFVTDADLATLTAEPHDVAAVEAAGVAARGPLFPTGPSAHLGPVHDVWLSYVDEGNDLKSQISFDRQEETSLLDDLRSLPLGESVPGRGTCWWDKPPASVDAQCQEILIPRHPSTSHGGFAPMPAVDTKDMRPVFMLQPLGGFTVWPVGEATWDTLPQTMAEGRDVLDGVAGPYDDFTPSPSSHDNDWHYPATFLFRTGRNRAGLLKLLESDAVGHRLHLQYRVVGSGPATRPTPLPTAEFLPARTVVIPAGTKEGEYGLALGSGQVRRSTTAPVDEWHSNDRVRQIGGDVSPTSFYKQTAVAGVRLVDATVWTVSDGAFDALPAGLVAAVTSHAKSETDDAFLMAAGENGLFHRTAVVRTRDGTAALVQVTAVSDAPRSATVRYKLVRSPTTKPAEK